MATIKTTPEIRNGDVVLTHGARVLIDGTPKEFPGNKFGPTFHYRGKVLNMNELQTTDHWFYSFILGGHESTDEGIRWTIQGNRLARWYVED